MATVRMDAKLSTGMVMKTEAERFIPAIKSSYVPH